MGREFVFLRQFGVRVHDITLLVSRDVVFVVLADSDRSDLLAMQAMRTGIERLTIPQQDIACICASNQSFAILDPLKCKLVLLLLVSQLADELDGCALPVPAWVCEVLGKVKLSVRVMGQHGWQVPTVVVELTELPVVRFARMRVESCLHGLGAVVELLLGEPTLVLRLVHL